MLTVTTATRTVSLANYITAWREVLAASDDAVFNESLTGFGPATRERVLRQFRAGMHDRINRHVDGYGVGRKWDDDWFRGMGHAARQLNTPRLRLHWLPRELHARFGERLCEWAAD